MILLPVSLVLMVFGSIFGLVGSLARSYTILTAVAVYFIICSKWVRFTKGSLYIIYDAVNDTMAEFAKAVNQFIMNIINIVDIITEMT